MPDAHSDHRVVLSLLGPLRLLLDNVWLQMMDILKLSEAEKSVATV